MHYDRTSAFPFECKNVLPSFVNGIQEELSYIVLPVALNIKTERTGFFFLHLNNYTTFKVKGILQTHFYLNCGLILVDKSYLR